MSDNSAHHDHPEQGENLPAVQAPPPAVWKGYQKILFRIAFVFFLLISIPLSIGWYRSAASIDWLRPHYRDIYSIARFNSSVRSFFGIGGRGAGGGGDEESTAPATEDGNARARNGSGREGRQEGGPRLGRAGAGNDSLGRNERRRQRFGSGAGRDSTSREGRTRNRNRQEFAGAEGGRRDGFRRRNEGGPDSLRGNNGERRREGFRRRGNGDSSGFAAAGDGERRFGRRSRNGDSSAFAGGEGSGSRRRNYGGDSTRTSGQEEGNFRRRNRGGDSATFAARGRGDRVSRRSREGGNAVAYRGERRNGRSGGKDSTEVSASNRDTIERQAGFGPGNGGGRGNGNGPGGPPLRSRSWLSDYTDWGYALLIATAAGLIWTVIDRKRKQYNVLYYVIKVVVRYRAGIGIIGFGFTKLFPTQMPYPSLGLLNTDFGDFTSQKIYWLSVGIVPWYQVFGGIVEILAGTLLLFRRTTALGAILLIGALGDITYVNYAYDGGVHVYACYFVLLGLFLLVDEIPWLYNLLILERYTVPRTYYPRYTNNWLGYTRYGLKGLTFLVFFVILTYTEVINFKYDPYKQPSTAGVKTLRGNYHVTEFRLNNQVIPYSPVDSTRWQQATFENWTTLTFKVNRPVAVDPSNGGGSPMRDIQRTFEITGTAGGQRAFHYYADTIDQVLYLQDKNAAASRRGGGRGRRENPEADERAYSKDWISEAAWKHIGDENLMIDSKALSARRDREFARPVRESNRNKMVLHYATVDGSRVILTGTNERKDSIYVVLDRVARKYVLPESTLKAGKY